MPLLDWEKTITCPYNPSHQITVERIQFHLVKCRKNHPTSDHVVCPYNASHHIPKPEEQYHISTCSDRKFVELTKYSYALERPGQHGNLTLPPPSIVQWGNSGLGVGEEDWEKEATVKQSYDPKKKASKTPVLRNLQGATPSQRKEFRAQEKIRIDNLQQAGLTDKVDLSYCKDDATVTKDQQGGGARQGVPRRDSNIPPLRRPALGQSDGVRPGSVTSALLAAHQGRVGSLGGEAGKGPGQQLRRPGSSLWREKVDVDTTKDTTDLDTTKDTLDVLDTTIDIDQRLNQLVLGKGRGKAVPLRRPSSLATFS